MMNIDSQVLNPNHFLNSNEGYMRDTERFKNVSEEVSYHSSPISWVENVKT